jgi:hypothetical protein
MEWFFFRESAKERECVCAGTATAASTATSCRNKTSAAPLLFSIEEDAPRKALIYSKEQ